MSFDRIVKERELHLKWVVGLLTNQTKNRSQMKLPLFKNTVRAHFSRLVEIPLCVDLT